MNVVREIDRINRRELELGITASWHDDFKDSAYIFVGGIPYELTEGDVICVFSQYGEILDLNMPRDKETGKPKGFAFLKYDDQRSTVLAVDNFNGATLLGRTLRVDHSRDYRQAKKKRRREDESESEESEEELDEDGKPRVKGFNVAPKGWLDAPVEVGGGESEEENLAEGIDPEDPMRDYLIEQRREKKEKEKKHRKKIKQEDDEEKGKPRHRHRSSHHTDKEGDRSRHRHRHHQHGESNTGKERQIESRRTHEESNSERSRKERDKTPKSRRNEQDEEASPNSRGPAH